VNLLLCLICSCIRSELDSAIFMAGDSDGLFVRLRNEACSSATLPAEA